MSKRVIPSASMWPDYFVPSPLPSLDSRLGAGLLVTLDLPVGEHVPGHLIILRTLELGGHFLVPISHAAHIAFRDEILDGLGTLEERDLAEKNRATFVQDFIERVPPDRRNELVVLPKSEDELHYEFFPGVSRREDLHDNLYVTASDDISTPYNGNHTGGTSSTGGISSSGDEDLGGRVPSSAKKLWLEFGPSRPPRTPWVERIEIDLIRHQLSEVWWH